MAAQTAGGVAVSGSLFTVGLAGVEIDLGLGGASFTVTGGQVDFAVLSTSANGSFTAAAGTGLAINATLGPVTIAATGGGFLYNAASGSDPVTNWAFASLAGLGSDVPVEVEVSGGGPRSPSRGSVRSG